MREFGGFYKSVGGTEGSHCMYPTRLDVYGCGCKHNCSYCYARSLLEFRGLWNPNEPSVANLDKVIKKLDEIEAGTVLRLGGMTDCFQECEEELGIAYQTIKAMNARGIHYLIVTKSDLIATPKYIGVLDPKLAHIQITVTTANEETARTVFGENAPSPERRIRAIERLSKQGFDVAMRISPFVPELAEIGRLNQVQVDKVIVEFLRVNGFIKKLLPIDLKAYRHKEGGYRHLPRHEKARHIRLLEFPQVSVCEDCDSHYEWWQAFQNPNPNDCCNLRL